MATTKRSAAKSSKKKAATAGLRSATSKVSAKTSIDFSRSVRRK